MTVIARPDHLLRDDVRQFIDRPKKLDTKIQTPEVAREVTE